MTHHLIASLIPSGTDLVVALGLADRLVGVSHECDHSAAVGLPVLTRSAIPALGREPSDVDPAEVDRLVCETMSAGDSLYVTHRELLHSLRPSVVVSQDVCDVCAVNGRTAACDLPEGAALVMLSATSIDGLRGDIERLGDALGVEDRATRLVAHVDERLAALDEKAHESLRAAAGRRPRVLALEWSDPPFLGGHWVPELIERCGGEHVLSSPGTPSRRSTWDEIAAADPDVIVFCPCGYSLDVAVEEAHRLLAQPSVASLRAVREGRFHVVDANRLLSRCTTNVVDAAELLVDLIWSRPCPDTTSVRTLAP